jgi:UDP-N-acetylmuramoyl-tripeptide--D-alanyl-D-alanine ligase
MRFSARVVAEATGGRLVGDDIAIDGVSFDSRSLAAGELFVPIIGDRDGHEFIPLALQRGANAYLTSRPAQGGVAIEVPDTLGALMALAAARRSTFDGPVIGVTGSVGKTSTKDLAWAALAASRRTWANERSFNNEQGLPTTILNAPDDTEVLVLEMGMRGVGQIAELCQIARPSIGVVTRVAEAHSDLVGGIEGVARSKAELVEALPSDGVAILNADDSRVRAMAAHTSARVLLFGEAADADVRVVDLSLDDLARPSFRLVTPWGSAPVSLAVSGRHMAVNAAAAIACVGAVGGDVQAGARAMSNVVLTAMRMDVRRTASGAVVVNDSYNANPTSMRAAIDSLIALPARRRLAVLGLMAEIADPAAEHVAVARYAAERGVRVVAFGTELYGLTPVTTVEAAVEAVGSLAGGDAVLVKGSRVVGLERVAAAMLLD